MVFLHATHVVALRCSEGEGSVEENPFPTDATEAATLYRSAHDLNEKCFQKTRGYHPYDHWHYRKFEFVALVFLCSGRGASLY